jgi:hypothetical protein
VTLNPKPPDFCVEGLEMASGRLGNAGT